MQALQVPQGPRGCCEVRPHRPLVSCWSPCSGKKGCQNFERDVSGASQWEVHNDSGKSRNDQDGRVRASVEDLLISLRLAEVTPLTCALQNRAMESGFARRNVVHHALLSTRQATVVMEDRYLQWEPGAATGSIGLRLIRASHVQRGASGSWVRQDFGARRSICTLVGTTLDELFSLDQRTVQDEVQHQVQQNMKAEHWRPLFEVDAGSCPPVGLHVGLHEMDMSIMTS